MSPVFRMLQNSVQSQEGGGFSRLVHLSVHAYAFINYSLNYY